MSENWKYQLSLKIENHLLNIRADTTAEFAEQLAWVEEHKEPILVTIASYAPQGPQPVAPAPTPRQAPIGSQNGTEREIGPISLEGVEIKKGPRDGPPWKSPMYVLKWEGSSCSTFDALNGKAAMGFWTQGAPCFLTIAPGKNPRYMNLTSIRSAVAS